MGKLHRIKQNISKFFALALCFLMLFTEAVPVFASYEVTISIPVRVEITGLGDSVSGDSTSSGSASGESISSDVVTVTMTPQDDAPAPTESSITITGEGTGTFEGLTYMKPGDYVYTVQMTGASEDIEYDSTIYTLTVRVTNADGDLVADYWVIQDDSTGKSGEIVFNNILPDNTAYYIVEHYLEQLDGTYKLADSYTYTAEIGETVTAIPNSYEHYSENTSHADRIETGVVVMPSATAATSTTMTVNVTTTMTATAIINTATTTSATTDVLTLRLYYDLDRYTITYVDGVDGSVVFEDQVYPDQPYGVDTPAFVGTPTRDGYTFMGWNPVVADTVTGDMIYVATWEPVASASNSEDTPSETPSEDDNSSTGFHIKTGDVKCFVMLGCLTLFLCGCVLVALTSYRRKEQK